MEKNYGLCFELVPDGCWNSNLRTLLPAQAWDFIRKDAYARAGGKCAICGARGRLEAHERWQYSVKNGVGVQKLVDVIAVCRACHETIHIGRTSLLGGEERAAEHFMKVNGVSYAEYRAALGKANEIHAELNKISEWALDLGYLKRFLRKPLKND